ncbi:MAG TPA: response regulator [Candidatus Limnocylindrales bacterium]|nr:response regulator [Candidatus Limnocylindrales bacterium]
MDPLRLSVELLFGLVFVFVLAGYIRHRDPVARDLALAFAGLGLTFITDVWRRLAGSTPPPVGIAVAVLLILQPIFVLHLVSLIRPVPRATLLGAGVALVGSVGAAIVFRSVPGLPLVALSVFVGIEVLAATLLLQEGRRRHGPGATRLIVAAGATGMFAVAIVSAGVGWLQQEIAGQAQLASIVLSLVAAVGYLVAFAPPAPVARAMQASATVGYIRRIIEMAGQPTDRIWGQFAELAANVAGGSAFVIVPSADGTATCAASSEPVPDGSGVPEPARMSASDLARLVVAARSGRDLSADDGLRSLLAPALDGARLTGIALGDRPEAPLLVLASRYRSLFAEADRVVLEALGAQTAIIVERRMIVAEQEQLSAQLSSTVEALRAASQAKSDFLASMSHELRTPLSAILGFSDLMRTEPTVDGNVTVPLEWVEHMHRGGEHLISLINDLLDLAKVEAGRLELRPETVDVAGLAAEVVNGLRPLAERKQLDVSIDAAPSILWADRGRLRQILYNLLSNAIKYTPDHGAVVVHVGGTSSSVDIEVRDTGVGIAPEDLDSVFEEFHQVGDHAARDQGTGLGLALTKRLVEAHGGTIRVTSVVGSGSRFRVSMPAPAHPVVELPVVAPDVPRDPALHVAGEQPAVLVIEDDPSAVRLLREYLEPAGYRVHVAAAGAEGLALARRLHPAAILLDVLLPGADGWEILRQAKADDAIAAIPVIIVTVVDEREVGLALGAVDYLVKPIRRDALLGSLRRHVGDSLSGGQPKVLAVDDEAVALDLIRAALEPEGFHVVSTTSALAALEMLREQPFDLVISDVVMPELDGFELARRIKADPRTTRIPILLCTAHDLSESEKAQLNGQIIGIASKGGAARQGLLRWLEPYRGTLRPAAG